MTRRSGIDPTFALAYNNRGDAWFDKGDLDRALTDFDAAIKHNPSLAIAYGNRGYLYHRKRDTARAIADYSMQIKLKPDVLAYINRGNVYRDTEQLERAAADYGAAAKIAPTDPRGWRNRGMIRLYQGDTKRGIADYDKALQYDPADAYSWNNRGHGQDAAGQQGGGDCGFPQSPGDQPQPAHRPRRPAATWRSPIDGSWSCNRLGCTYVFCKTYAPMRPDMVRDRKCQG